MSILKDMYQRFLCASSKHVPSASDMSSQPQLKVAEAEFKSGYLDYCLKNPQVFIEISSVCNFSCFYCKSKDSSRKMLMSNELFYQVLPQLSRVTSDRIRLHLDGEPLLNKKFHEYATALNEAGHGISLATNGSLLKEELIDLDMTIMINLSTSASEFEKRSAMGFDTYIDILSRYINAWSNSESIQTITLGVYSCRSERLSDEIMRCKRQFVKKFLENSGAFDAQYFEDGDTVAKLKNHGGAVLSVRLFNITSGGLYPKTESWCPTTTYASNVGFCDSPWKRLGILADGRLAYCCLDLSGSTAFTRKEEIWNAPLEQLFYNHKNIQAVRLNFLRAKVQHPTCRLCLDRMPMRIFENGFGTTYKDFTASKM